MPYFPTEQWLAEYARLLNENEAFRDLGEGWGDGFDGDVRYVITDLPVAETTLGDLPDEMLSELPAHVRERVADVTVADAPETFAPIRSEIPAPLTDKLDQLEAHVHGDTVYAHLELEDGACTGVSVLDAPDERDAGFVLRGPYDAWRQIVDGRPSASAVLTRDLEFEGSTFRRLQYSPMFQLLGDVASQVETTHLFEAGDASPPRLLDTAMEGRMHVQRRTRRRVKRAFDLF